MNTMDSYQRFLKLYPSGFSQKSVRKSEPSPELGMSSTGEMTQLPSSAKLVKSLENTRLMTFKRSADFWDGFWFRRWRGGNRWSFTTHSRRPYKNGKITRNNAP